MFKVRRALEALAASEGWEGTFDPFYDVDGDGSSLFVNWTGPKGQEAHARFGGDLHESILTEVMRSELGHMIRRHS